MSLNKWSRIVNDVTYKLAFIKAGNTEKESKTRSVDYSVSEAENNLTLYLLWSKFSKMECPVYDTKLPLMVRRLFRSGGYGVINHWDLDPEWLHQ